MLERIFLANNDQRRRSHHRRRRHHHHHHHHLVYCNRLFPFLCYWTIFRLKPISSKRFFLELF